MKENDNGCVHAALEPAYVVAMFDIDRFVYVFFRELAVESTALCDKTYYSRVARVCKVITCSMLHCSLFVTAQRCIDRPIGL